MRTEDVHRNTEASLRSGYTTGTCAAGAAKAAARMLRTGCPDLSEIRVVVPRGDVLYLPVLEIRRDAEAVSCAVRKDSGDDPDVTNGVLVYAEVALSRAKGVRIEGGEGVGIVTKPGLDQPVGNAAINSVPRRMIAEAVEEELEGTGCGAVVTISIPAGIRLAEKTFNPRLGIEGGISVLGTSGIVEPMSDDAMRGTIRAEVSVRLAEGWPVIPVCPGNYGQEFLKKTCGLDSADPVLSSNYIADAMEICTEAGAARVLFAGHLGKLVKVAGGIRNTHSKYGDHRMEILTRFAEPYVRPERPADRTTDAIPGTWRKMLADCAAVDEAVRLLTEWGIREDVMRDVTRAVKKHLEAFSEGRVRADVILFSNVYGILGRSDGAIEALLCFQEWKARRPDGR